MKRRASRLRAGALALAGAVLLAACAPDIVDKAAAPEGVGPLGDAAAEGFRAAPGFGEIAVVCDLPRNALGRKVDRRPEKGSARWELYDTRPGSTAPRAFHLTGFEDGCARRISASLVMFGSVELYELVHFGGLGAEGETGATDRAYRSIRAAACGARARTRPCDEAPLKRLSRSTAFLTAFPQKGNPRHLEMLVHDGALAATAVK